MRDESAGISSSLIPHPSSLRSAEEVLRQCLEPVILELFGGVPACGSSAIAAIHRKRFNLSTSYDTYIVTVHLTSGDEVKVFLKDFGVTVRPKDGAKQRREREICVYRELFADANLGTPRYYGSVLDESEGQLWLLLEYVEGTPVGYLDIGESWARAAGALGRLHGHFAEHSSGLCERDFLLHHQPSFFWSRAERAVRCVEQIAPQRAGQLTGILDGYDPIVAMMTSQPPTLLHGGCRTSNILVKVTSDPSRVCIIDWEEAAYGSPVFDLAYLLDGIEFPTLDPLLDAYRQEALAYSISLPPKEDTKYLMDCFRLHMILDMLSRAVIKGYAERDVAKLLGIGSHLSSIVSRR